MKENPIITGRIGNIRGVITLPENNERPEISTSNDLGRAVLSIANCYIDGYTSLKFLSELLDIQRNNQEKFFAAPAFFNFLWGICYQSVIINLSNIIVLDKESINIYYLLNLLEQYLRQTKEQKEIIDLCNTTRKIIECYSKDCDFYKGLKELRDKYIAHIDKARFHEAVGPTKKINLSEIKVAYDSIGSLIGEFIGKLGINPDLMDFEQLNGANLQFRLLISQLESKPLI